MSKTLELKIDVNVNELKTNRFTRPKKFLQ